MMDIDANNERMDPPDEPILVDSENEQRGSYPQIYIDTIKVKNRSRPNIDLGF
jgi:hypothetical protein